MTQPICHFISPFLSISISLSIYDLKNMKLFQPFTVNKRTRITKQKVLKENNETKKNNNKSKTLICIDNSGYYKQLNFLADKRFIFLKIFNTNDIFNENTQRTFKQYFTILILMHTDYNLILNIYINP